MTFAVMLVAYGFQVAIVAALTWFVMLLFQVDYWKWPLWKRWLLILGVFVWPLLSFFYVVSAIWCVVRLFALILSDVLSWATKVDK